MLPSLNCLFLHEYIHFIQDVTTRYGLMKAANMYAYTSQIAHCIRTNPHDIFQTPQSLHKCQHVDNVIYFNAKTWKHYLGSSFEVRNKYEKKKLQITNCKLYSVIIEGKIVENVELTVSEASGKIIGKLFFGGEIMSESMAFIAEQLCAERYGISMPPFPAYPYMITELLVEKVYPELLQRRDIVYICIDSCLYYAFNPGPSFIHLINDLKTHKFHENWDMEILNDILSKLFETNIPFDKCIEETIRLIKWNFQLSFLDTTIKWIEKIYERALSLRRFPLFTKCFIGNEEADRHFLQIVIDIMGIPPLHNDINEASMTLPMNMFSVMEAYDVHPEYFNAISCLLSVFNGKKPCGMKDFCNASKTLNNHLEVNQTCDEPWLKLGEAINTNRQLCPFALLWKHWGLSGKEPE